MLDGSKELKTTESWKGLNAMSLKMYRKESQKKGRAMSNEYGFESSIISIHCDDVGRSLDKIQG